jgi:hypothetical protein
MKPGRQMSLCLSESTNERLDRFIHETGVSKDRVIEDAIVSCLDAYDELPESAIIPRRIVLTKESGARFLEQLEEDPEPTEALIKLMRDHR